MDKKEIAKKLKASRKSMKLSIDDVIKFLSDNGFNVKSSTIYGWENGRRSPDIDVFFALCNLYGIDNMLKFNTDGRYIHEKGDISPEAYRIAMDFDAAPDYIKNTIRAALNYPKEHTPDNAPYSVLEVAAYGGDGMKIELTKEEYEQAEKLRQRINIRKK